MSNEKITIKMLDKAFAMHQEMEFKCKNKTEKLFHSNMKTIIRIEEFNLFPEIFGRLATLEVKESIDRLNN